MARKKGLGIFGSILGASIKLSSIAIKETNKSIQRNKKASAIKERKEQIELEREISRLKTLNDNLDAIESEQKAELKQVRAERMAWEREFRVLTSLRTKAVGLEKQNKFVQAIKWHIKSINFGESSDRMGYHNYAHSIKRVIILYGKTKDKTSLKDYLQEIIDKYPSVREREDWEKRLAKIKS